MTREVIEERRSEAERRLQTARNVYRSAIDAYERDPSRINRIAALAARRCVKESEAQAEEWSRD